MKIPIKNAFIAGRFSEQLQFPPTVYATSGWGKLPKLKKKPKKRAKSQPSSARFVRLVFARNRH
jgi:hypothetical protein